MEINSNQNKNNDTLEVPRKGVHTLTNDIAHEAVAGTPGTIRAIIDAEEGREIEKEHLKVGYSVNQLYMIFGFIALILSAGLLYYFLFFIAVKDNSGASQFTQDAKNMFLVDKSASIELAGLNKTKTLKTIVDASEKVFLPPEQIQVFNLTEDSRQISLARFLEITEANVSLPEGNIFSSDFMFGVFSSEGNHPFFILKVKSMNDAFPTMRAWENKILNDLGQIFNYEISPDNQYLLTKDFQDDIVQNKNARVLYDDLGSIVMMYVYLDDTTILISNYAGIAGEVIERKSSSNIRK